MIQFPSDRPDAGNRHVAGSQRKADNLIARNCKRAAKAQSSPAQKHIAPAVPQTTVRTISISATTVAAIAFACMALAILAALITAGGGVR